MRVENNIISFHGMKNFQNQTANTQENGPTFRSKASASYFDSEADRS